MPRVLILTLNCICTLHTLHTKPSLHELMFITRFNIVAHIKAVVGQLVYIFEAFGSDGAVVDFCIWRPKL